MKIIGFLMLALLLSSNQAYATDDQRWYSDAQVTRGETLFRRSCAGCHGQNAEATPDWKKTDADGNYPPPPLNGTAHTWHHDMNLLRRTIREGGAELGGQMPAFEGVLDAAEIDSIIAFFQSKWPQDVYQRWADRFGDSELPSLSDVAPTRQKDITRRLRQRLGDIRIGDLAKTPVGDVWQVQIGNNFMYLIDDGRYVLAGEMINLENGLNLTRQSRHAANVRTLSQFRDEDLVVFEASGESRATLNIFTDTSCVYCQKMHAEIGHLQEAGITVRYLPFPRGGAGGAGYQTLKSVWCAGDRNSAMTDAKDLRVDGLPPGDCAESVMVDRGYRAGKQIGVRGTPALLLSSGEKIEGYMSYRELIPRLLGTTQ